MQISYEEVVRQRDLLMAEIVKAAQEAGIANADARTDDGPLCLLLLRDLAEAAWKYNDMCD